MSDQKIDWNKPYQCRDGVAVKIWLEEVASWEWQGENLIGFGQKLREIRTQKGWNQEQLAAEMEITQASVSQFENGTRQPTPALARKFADVMEVPLTDLVGEGGPGVLEHHRLMRNLKGLSPKTLETINTIVEAIRQKELPKRQGKK